MQDMVSGDDNRTPVVFQGVGNGNIVAGIATFRVPEQHVIFNRKNQINLVWQTGSNI